MSERGLLTRKQRIVKRLGNCRHDESRVASLPAMLRRHGLLQVLLFLVAKNDQKEQALAEDLILGITAALGEGEASDVRLFISDLANEENLSLTLRRWEAAIEVASLLKMLVRAPEEAP